MRFFREAVKDRHPSAETLCSYLDGELRSKGSQRLQGHLATCQRCSQETESLQETVDLLRAVPMLPVPRSFVLTPEMVPSRGVSQRPVLALRAAAFAVLAVLAIVVTSDATSLIGTQNPTTSLQSGMEESGVLITSGTAPSPEEAVPLTPFSEGALSPPRAVTPEASAVQGVSGQASNLIPLPEANSRGFLTLWPLELALLLVGLLTLLSSRLLPRWRRLS